MTSTYAGQRRSHLEALAAELPERGLASRALSEHDPMLWVWHPGTGRQTIVFASPSAQGWVFLWSPDGHESADEPGHAADMLAKLLSQPT